MQLKYFVGKLWAVNAGLLCILSFYAFISATLQNQ